MKNPERSGRRVDRLTCTSSATPRSPTCGRRSAKVAQAKLAAGATGDEKAFYEAKLATARFFMSAHAAAPRPHFAQIMAGASSIQSFPDDAF